MQQTVIRGHSDVFSANSEKASVFGTAALTIQQLWQSTKQVKTFKGHTPPGKQLRRQMCNCAAGKLSEKAAAAAAMVVLAEPWKEVPAKSRGVHLSGSIFNFPV